MNPKRLSELITFPIQAAIRAQSAAALESVTVIRQLMRKDGTMPNVTFKLVRTVEETVQDTNTGEVTRRAAQQPIEISVPLLALTGASSVKISELTVDFGILLARDVSENNEIWGSITSASSTKLPADIKIQMKMVNDPREGQSRLVDLATDMIDRVPTKEDMKK